MLQSITTNGGALSFLRVKKLRKGTIVLYHFANGHTALEQVGVAQASDEPISAREFDELAALRKAQAWGAPLFQPCHPNYQDALIRLKELERKEYNG
jgi:hypothetical protein